ncbi:hypothetical protein COLO4_12495 [Corchorus olitorius]|uniref:Uncharacterized protein n=1 Tax=Corchorus olitorius TaxID=93759 RepID=A0A1R3K0L0_9ROSI|nr:hypothetical protein COLO4_12495 [Corchorus olitorius]
MASPGLEPETFRPRPGEGGFGFGASGFRRPRTKSGPSRVGLGGARRLRAVDNNKNKLGKELHYSIKNDMKDGFKKNMPTGVAEMTSTSSKEAHGSIKEESIDKSRSDDSQKLEDAVQTVKNAKGKGSGAVVVQTNTKKSVVSVSWRVPHRKRGEKHPGFNLDYSPPKTHPPSHN